MEQNLIPVPGPMPSPDGIAGIDVEITIRLKDGSRSVRTHHSLRAAIVFCQTEHQHAGEFVATREGGAALLGNVDAMLFTLKANALGIMRQRPPDPGPNPIRFDSV